jgi:2-polyprenyl-3-methyl-5-hydroxy-6-metoxy-1,4-benzoquinol methylase
MADDVARERALVQAGWELAGLLGQLDAGKARKMLAGRWDAERARAAATLGQLKTGNKVGKRDLATYTKPSVQARFRRTLDYVQPGERVFEIGPGRGWLAGLILREGGAAAYRGTDLKASNLPASQQLFDLNGLADRAELAERDLYDLTRAELEEFGADLVVCCEVIEHVPDPELAVKALAAALPADADLLLSVPLLGRLEGVWEHFAIFDTARARAIVEQSGLTVHAVDVVDNMWVFVLASHDPGPSARADRAAAAPLEGLAAVVPDSGAPRTVRNLTLADLAVGPSAERHRLARHRVELGGDGVRCELTAKRSRRSNEPSYGGVRLPVSSPRGIRLQLAFDDIDAVTMFYVDAYAGQKRVSRWRWDPVAKPLRESPATFVLRPGRYDKFRRTEVGPIESADAFDIVVAVKPGASARFRLTRAGVIGS